jgi:hypothetical protein
MTIVLLLALTQSLLQDDASPYDPPKKPALKKHDHVTIEFAAPGKGAADAKPRWDRELRQWIRSDAKEMPATAVTAEVVDVRPNGTMVLLAVKRRTVNGVQEALRLTGEVAPANVTAGKVSADHVLNLSVAIDADK